MQSTDGLQLSPQGSWVSVPRGPCGEAKDDLTSESTSAEPGQQVPGSFEFIASLAELAEAGGWSILRAYESPGSTLLSNLLRFPWLSTIRNLLRRNNDRNPVNWGALANECGSPHCNDIFSIGFLLLPCTGRQRLSSPRLFLLLRSDSIGVLCCHGLQGWVMQISSLSTIRTETRNAGSMQE